MNRGTGHTATPVACARLDSVDSSQHEPAPRPRTLAFPAEGTDDQWDVDRKLAASWRAQRLGPTVERLRKHILSGGEHSIEPGQFRALDSIAAHGPCPVRELAMVMDVEPSTATRATARLEALGLVIKRRGEADHREVLLELTPAGRDLHTYFVDRAFDTYEEIFSVFTLDERIILSDLLERMLKSTEHTLARPEAHRWPTP